MAVIIDIQTLLPRMRAIGSALTGLCDVTSERENLTELRTPAQRAAMKKVNVEQANLYEDLLTLMISKPSQRAAEGVALQVVFRQVTRCLEGRPLSLEALEAYETDAAGGDHDVRRLRGFLQGLYAAGALSFEDYCEVDAVLVTAFDL